MPCLLAQALSHLQLVKGNGPYGSSHLLIRPLNLATESPDARGLLSSPHGSNRPFRECTLSLQLSTRTLPSTPMQVDYCRGDGRFATPLSFMVLNNRSTWLSMSHSPPPFGHGAGRPGRRTHGRGGERGCGSRSPSPERSTTFSPGSPGVRERTGGPLPRDGDLPVRGDRRETGLSLPRRAPHEGPFAIHPHPRGRGRRIHDAFEDTQAETDPGTGGFREGRLRALPPGVPFPPATIGGGPGRIVDPFGGGRDLAPHPHSHPYRPVGRAGGLAGPVGRRKTGSPSTWRPGSFPGTTTPSGVPILIPRSRPDRDSQRRNRRHGEREGQGLPGDGLACASLLSSARNLQRVVLVVALEMAISGSGTSSPWTGGTTSDQTRDARPGGRSRRWTPSSRSGGCGNSSSARTRTKTSRWTPWPPLLPSRLPWGIRDL